MYICHFFNLYVDKGSFPSVLKHADITPVFEKGYRGSKEIYRPVSILPVISKIFGKLLCNQMTPFMDQFLSKYHCGFRIWLFICCKTKFKKYLFFFIKYTLFAEKNAFIWKKSFIMKKIFYWKKTFFYIWKYKWKCKNICLISEMYFYTENVCVTNKI